MAVPLTKEKFALLPRIEAVMYAVVDLVLTIEKPAEWNKKWIPEFPHGTGFFYHVKQGVTLLVTCKHVIEDYLESVPDEYKEVYEA